MSPTSRRARHLTQSQILAYVLIVIVGALGFYGQGRTQDQLCEESYENRQATRAQATAIRQLGEELVTQGEDTITPDQREALDDFEAFERRQLRALDLPVCD